jgi:outer membrane lipoprotein-sorting protein
MMDRRTLLLGSLGLAGLGLAAVPAYAQLEALPYKDRRLADQAAAYLQTLKQAKAHFTQTNSNGRASGGTLYLNRPGKARFEYDPPAEMLIVSDGRNVSIYDRRLKTFDKAPLGATPLAIFLARRIRLDEDVRVTGLTRRPGGFSISAVDGKGQAEGKLILEFNDNPISLAGWTVIDAQGLQTKVRLSGLAPASGFDPALFVLNDPRKAARG